MLQNNFLTSVLANKIELLRTMHNAPYVHPSLDSILKLCQTFRLFKIDFGISYKLNLKNNKQHEKCHCKQSS